MQGENVVGNENLDVAIQNMNIGQDQNLIDLGGNQIGDARNDVRINIDDENARNRGIAGFDNQQNQGQIVGPNNIAEVVANHHNRDPLGLNDQIIPAVAAGARNNQRIYPQNQRIQNFPLQQVNNQQLFFGNHGGHGFPLGQEQNQIPPGNLIGPAPMGARNQEVLVQRQRQNQQADDDGGPINLADHNRAPNVYQDPNVQAPQGHIQNYGQREFPQIHQNDGNFQGGGNYQNRANQEIRGLQNGGRLANNINRNLEPLAHRPQDQQYVNQRNALQIPDEPHANRNANREAVYTRHNNRQNNRHAPYVNMRRMSQNAKKMAMMIWSMADAAMYVPNQYNNNITRNNPQDRDDDDEGSQYSQ